MNPHVNDVQIVRLQPKREYDDGNTEDQHFMVAESRFHRMLASRAKDNASFKLDSVDLVKNEKLWTKFKNKQKEFEVMGKNCKPLMIFHGTNNENIEPIVRNNFNIDKVSHGRVYGDGVYFSECPEISMKYNYGSDKLLLCQVLLGNTMKGRLIPGYDSTEVQNKSDKERCFAIVIPDVDQIYPTYIINFSRVKQKHDYSFTQISTSLINQYGYQKAAQLVPPMKGKYQRRIAGHYRLRRLDEFPDKISGQIKEQQSFEAFLDIIGFLDDAKDVFKSLTQMFAREEISGGQRIFFHHMKESGEQMFVEEITPGIVVNESNILKSTNKASYQCAWKKKVNLSGRPILVKTCRPVLCHHGIPYTITRNFQDTYMITTYAVNVPNGFMCELIYLRCS